MENNRDANIPETPSNYMNVGSGPMPNCMNVGSGPMPNCMNVGSGPVPNNMNVGSGPMPNYMNVGSGPVPNNMNVGSGPMPNYMNVGSGPTPNCMNVGSGPMPNNMNVGSGPVPNYMNVGSGPMPNCMNVGSGPMPNNMNGGTRIPPQGYMNNTAYRRNPMASADRFRMYGIPVLVYAVVCAACLYNNWSSILSAVMAVVSIIFISMSIVRHEKRRAAMSGMMVSTQSVLSRQVILIPYYIIIFLLSTALCLTDDAYIIFGCNVGVILMEMYAVMTYFNDTGRYGIFKGVFSFLELFFGAVGYINMPFVDRRAEREKTGRSRNSKLMYVLLGCAIALPILVIVLNILSSADPVFAKVIKDIFGKIFFSWDIVKIILFAFVIFLFVYGFMVKAGRSDLVANAPRDGQYDSVIGITVTVILTIFYLIFAVVQIVYLFMNSAGLPDGMTYAKYARQGFFQLLFVAVVNVCLVLIFSAIFRKSQVLNVSLLMMCICTYIMIASSAVRLSMYISEYDLTYLRINTIWALVVTSIVMFGVIVSLFWSKMPLFRYILMTVVVLFTLYAFIRPGAVIAKYNLAQHHSGRSVDVRYVMNIGSDGVPYMIDYLEDKGITANDTVRKASGHNDDDDMYSYYSEKTVGTLLNDILEENDDKGYVRSFNISRYRASKMIRSYTNK